MSEQNTYDEMPYPDLAFQRTHPNRSAALATVFGLTPPAPDRARILELGCAAGANLLPMGVELPNASLLGVDLSSRQIEAGEAMRKAARINNVTLMQEDILRLDKSIGEFDYIIAHGLLSWVPPEIQDKVLDICRDHLAPNGIAYISYNINPGWHFRGGLREMMLYHVAGLPDAHSRVQHARALLDFLALHAPAGPHADMLKAEAELMRKQADGYIYHEFLERENHPFYFHEFVARLRRRGLSYLGETQLAVMMNRTFNPQTMEALDRISGRDVVRMGQYADFLGNRAFRESLIVRGEQPIRRRLDWRNITNLWVSSTLRPENAAIDPTGTEAETFVSGTGTQIRLKDPFTKVAVMVLRQNQPRPLAFNELLEQVRGRMRSRQPLEQDKTKLGEYVLEAFGLGVMDLLAHPWPCTASIEEKPRTSRLAQVQAEAGQAVTNLLHQHISYLTPDHLRLISLLDGDRTTGEAIEALYQRIDRERLPERARSIANDPSALRRMFNESMRSVVADLRDLGLLLA